MGTVLIVTRVMCWCTYMVSGGLLTPCAMAVTCATPVGPGVQIAGAMSESQVPAQAAPLVATVSTAGLLD